MSPRLTSCCFVLVLLAGSGICTAQGRPISSLDDIEFWIGSGANKAALAIDWNGEAASDQSYVWGYRWDGSKNGIEMLIDVLAADSRLYAKLGAVAGLGTAVVGVGYDQNEDGLFALTDNTLFDERGINFSDLDDGESSLDPTDFYAEGWFLGYWHLGIASANPFEAASWTHSFVGIDDISLMDQSWVSLAFATDTRSTTEFAENPIAAVSPYSADFDLDSDIDGTDFLTWQQGIGIVENALHAEGDANGDQRVDALDLHIWKTGFGTSSALRVLSSVPEPGSTTLVFLGILLLGPNLGESGRTLWRSI